MFVFLAKLSIIGDMKCYTISVPVWTHCTGSVKARATFGERLPYEDAVTGLRRDLNGNDLPLGVPPASRPIYPVN